MMSAQHRLTTRSKGDGRSRISKFTSFGRIALCVESNLSLKMLILSGKMCLYSYIVHFLKSFNDFIQYKITKLADARDAIY